MSGETAHLMRLIDQATDDSSDEAARDTLAQIAAALAAIKILLLRRDDEMWDEWMRY